MPNKEHSVAITLCSVIVTVDGDMPKVLLIRSDDGSLSLPSGVFLPDSHRSLEAGLKGWVERQTGIRLEYIEQLYTFGNRYRSPETELRGERLFTVSYLALTPHSTLPVGLHAEWAPWYRFFPWEDHRDGIPGILEHIRLRLEKWIEGAPTDEEKTDRRHRADFAFFGREWDTELVLARYELLYEAGLVSESLRDWSAYEPGQREELPISHELKETDFAPLEGDKPLNHDHRRILASALGRFRAKIKYRPLIFELLPPEFTLLRIQKALEALSGVCIHKQNFRRDLLASGLVKETPNYDRSSPGRPAQLFAFRKRAVLERASLGVRYPSRKTQ